jgi:hypothetical protein
LILFNRASLVGGIEMVFSVTVTVAMQGKLNGSKLKAVIFLMGTIMPG